MEFTQENFSFLLERNQELEKVLNDIINGAVHPDIAVRRIIVDLKPIREVLNKKLLTNGIEIVNI